MAEAGGGEVTTSAAGDFFKAKISQAAKRGDIILALGVVAILVVLILPLPRWLLDVALAFSITFSVLILMTALFVEKPLDFNAFPTVLLLATMISGCMMPFVASPHCRCVLAAIRMDSV